MRHVALGCALACAGCSSILGIEDLTLADAAPPVDTERCYGTLATRCYDAPPEGDVTLSGAIDTATDARCEALAQTDGPELCLIAGGTITIDATGVVATGARPLMLVAATTITITGTLDVASRRGTQLGAGANATVCATLAPGGTARHGGGGAGGSFGSAGQIGGRGGGDPDLDEVGASGLPAPSQTATFVRGGCAGGTGGAGMAALPGAGGDGGGAVYLVAGTSIAVDGQLQASGAGGAGPAESSGSSGGGGGGAGGLVALEAPMITVTGSVVANGGGGGEGGGETAAGAAGDDGSVFDAAANGGAGMSEGGDGGKGFALGSAAKVGAQGTPGTGQHGGGGGGGGGAGVVWIKGVHADASISPAPTVAQ